MIYFCELVSLAHEKFYWFLPFNTTLGTSWYMFSIYSIVSSEYCRYSNLYTKYSVKRASKDLQADWTRALRSAAFSPLEALWSLQWFVLRWNVFISPSFCSTGSKQKWKSLSGWDQWTRRCSGYHFVRWSASHFLADQWLTEPTLWGHPWPTSSPVKPAWPTVRCHSLYLTKPNPQVSRS